MTAVALHMKALGTYHGPRGFSFGRAVILIPKSRPPTAELREPWRVVLACVHNDG